MNCAVSCSVARLPAFGYTSDVCSLCSCVWDWFRQGVQLGWGPGGRERAWALEPPPGFVPSSGSPQVIPTGPWACLEESQENKVIHGF